MQQSNVVYQKETAYFILCLAISFLIYLIAAISIVGLIIIGVFILFSLIMNAFFIGSIRGNGVRLSEEQFPDEYKRIEELSREMGLKRVPDVFIVQSEGMLNAFATRFFGRNTVVLYSEVFDLARQKGEKELEFIIAHELAHVKRRHVLKHWLILPSMWMPFLGEAYLRAAEHTCDRHAAFYIQDAEAAKNALKILAIGKMVYGELNEDAYLRQIQEETNPFVWIAEMLSSHPNLPKRIQHIGLFMELEGTPTYQTNRLKVGMGVALILIVLFFIWIGVVMGITTVVSKVDLDSFFADDTSSSYSDYDYDEEVDYAYGETELMIASLNNDVETVGKLLADGVEVDELDIEGSSALHYAIYGESVGAVEHLLAAGADPNIEDEIGNLPLILAFEFDFLEVAELLLKNGADPDLAPVGSLSARELAIDYGDEAFIDLFEKYD